MMRSGVFFQGKYVSLLVKDDVNAPKNCVILDGGLYSGW